MTPLLALHATSRMKMNQGHGFAAELVELVLGILNNLARWRKSASAAVFTNGSDGAN